IASPGTTPAIEPADPADTADTTTTPAASLASVTPSAARRGNGSALVCGHAAAALNERITAARAAHACRAALRMSHLSNGFRYAAREPPAHAWHAARAPRPPRQ